MPLNGILKPHSDFTEEFCLSSIRRCIQFCPFGKHLSCNVCISSRFFKIDSINCADRCEKNTLSQLVNNIEITIASSANGVPSISVSETWNDESECQIRVRWSHTLNAGWSFTYLFYNFYCFNANICNSKCIRGTLALDVVDLATSYNAKIEKTYDVNDRMTIEICVGMWIL